MKHIDLQLEPGVRITSKEVLWNSTGEKLAVGLNDTQILVWDVYKNTQLRIFTGIDNDWIFSVAWDPTDNDTIACLVRSSDHIWRIKIWDARYNNELKFTMTLYVYESDYTITIHNIRWAPNGEFILCTGLWRHFREDDKSFFGVLKWTKRTDYTDKLLLFKKQPITGYPLSAFMEFSPDSQVIACGMAKCGYIDLINTNNGEKLTTIICARGEPDLNMISWSPNGNMLVTCGVEVDGGWGTPPPPSVKIWSVLTQKMIRLIESLPSEILPDSTYTSIKWNHINDMLAVATVDTSGITKGEVTIWHAPEGILRHKRLISFEVLDVAGLGLRAWTPFHLAWNPVDATALATAGGNRIQVWEVLPTVTVTDVMQREWRHSSALFCLLTY